MEALPSISTGHLASDIAMWALIAVLVIFRAVEILRTWGLLPERGTDRQSQAKPVGRLHVESLKTIIRHEIRDMLQPLTTKMAEYNEKQLDQLREMNLGIREVATILRERKS